MGKPSFPKLDFSGGVTRPTLSSFVAEKSWLIFDLLGLQEPQDWLLKSCREWEMVPKYGVFLELARNLSVCNDVAERGIQLISTFIGKAESEGQRDALLQVVERHRSLVSTTKLSKKELKKC